MVEPNGKKGKNRGALKGNYFARENQKVFRFPENDQKTVFLLRALRRGKNWKNVEFFKIGRNFWESAEHQKVKIMLSQKS